MVCCDAHDQYGCLQKDSTPARAKNVSNRRFSYKFNFVLDTEDAMMACNKKRKKDGEKMRAANKSNMLQFQQRMISQMKPVMGVHHVLGMHDTHMRHT
jgi:hypothetical protein